MSDTAVLDRDARFDRLDAAIQENRVCRGAWTTRDDKGRQLACLLVQVAPEVHEGGDTTSACPADLMPAWFAQLTVWIDDKPSDEHWPEVIRRYAALGRRWHVLTADDWQRLQFTVRAIAVREAMAHTQDKAVLAACKVSLDLCERAAKGDVADDATWSAARAAAYAAAYAAADAAADAAAYAAADAAAYAAADAAAYAAAYAAADAAADAAACAAARAAADAAACAAADAAADAAACAAADAAACDRMIDAALDAMEAAIVAREQAA